MILALPHVVWGARKLWVLWGLSTLSVQSIGQTLNQFRAVLLDLDADLTRDGLRHLYALGVEPLRIVDDLSQCQAHVRRFSANAVVLVPPSGPVDAHHPVLAVRALIGPDLGLCIVLRENLAEREEELLAGGGDIVLSLDGEAARQRARLAALTRRLQESVVTPASEDLYLDSRARQAFLEGRPLPLTDRLFWVLEFMVKHPAQVLTPEDFCAMLAAKGVHIQALSTPNLIHRLRRILEKYGMGDRIHSVHKRGYRWDDPDAFPSSQRSKADKFFTVNMDWHRGNFS
ncbi:winged helix-turn-helix domain-containing protein [Acidithiobacillus sulfuriphilus]|uniref:Winged helix family transcriptional regulator n=2 Tax=Acidithiobacillus sulfuriphilus TaxID=1867749 RepID=A0A3M8QVJ2_9PROT|nr:winged helix-turn-helix domain-containing protein [Acidithiobacillus sulfuriphilus]RNF59472.1 winged helix family transcriptional regulator [Acidithiobacillus sulfuriphilus]